LTLNIRGSPGDTNGPLHTTPQSPSLSDQPLAQDHS
jgi:hypothetical protein